MFQKCCHENAYFCGGIFDFCFIFLLSTKWSTKKNIYFTHSVKLIDNYVPNHKRISFDKIYLFLISIYFIKLFQTYQFHDDSSSASKQLILNLCVKVRPTYPAGTYLGQPLTT